MKSFQTEQFTRLHHELMLSPWRHRLHHLAGILRAISLVDPRREYPFSFIRFQITGFRSRTSDDDVQLCGKAIIEELVDLADSMTEAHPLPAAAAQGPAFSAEQLASRFRVSSKTISRWRRRGLLGCWYTAGAEGAKQFLFTNRAVQCFVARNLELVRRGASFRLMDDHERSRLISRARELVALGQTTLHAVTLRLAAETGRAVETIRYTLRRFDFENPAEALFDRVETAKPMDVGAVVLAAYLDGDSLQEIGRRIDKTESETRALIQQEQVNRHAGTPIEYIYNAEFDEPDAERRIMAPLCNSNEEPDETAPTLSRAPAELPPYLQELYRTPLLTAAQERHLFRQMNFILHLAETARRRIAADPSRASVADVEAVSQRLAEATPIKNQLIQSNLRLVVSIAKRHLSGDAVANLFELVSDGNVALIRAVEKFDYARGFRFSTYATWAITRSYARSVPETHSHADRFRTGFDELLLTINDRTSIPFPSESREDHLRAQVAGCLDQLDSRERSIIECHFGFTQDGQSQTLDEIGRSFGISKERVRQIEMRALQKIRDLLGDHGPELLAG